MSERLVIGVDPGLRACGVAVADVQSSELLRAWLVKSPEKEDDGAGAWLAMAQAVALEVAEWLERPFNPGARVEALYVERQQIRARPGRDQGASQGPHMELMTRNPNQILGLAYVTGATLALVPAIRKWSPYPSTWHGKDSHAARVQEVELQDLIWSRMTPAEQERAEGARKSTGHNVLEAVGIAKWGAARARLGLL